MIELVQCQSKMTSEWLLRLTLNTSAPCRNGSVRAKPAKRRYLRDRFDLVLQLSYIIL